MSGWNHERTSRNDLLPEAELGGGLPELVELFLVTGLEQHIVDDEQRVRRHVGGECGELDEAGHCAK